MVHFFALLCEALSPRYDKTFQSPVTLPFKKRTATTTCKNLWVHPRQTSIQWRKNGREALAPLGTQPEGVSCLSGTCAASLHSGGLLLQARQQNLTDQQSDTTLPFSTFWLNMESVAGDGEDQQLDLFFVYVEWGGWINRHEHHFKCRHSWLFNSAQRQQSGGKRVSFLIAPEKVSSRSKNRTDFTWSSWRNLARMVTKKKNKESVSAQHHKQICLGTMEYLTEWFTYTYSLHT